jgi:hypothetical protein
LEGLRLSMLKQDGHGGHEDLCGSDRWSVIPYIHERMRVVVLPYVLFNSKIEFA